MHKANSNINLIQKSSSFKRSVIQIRGQGATINSIGQNTQKNKSQLGIAQLFNPVRASGGVATAGQIYINELIKRLKESNSTQGDN